MQILTIDVSRSLKRTLKAGDGFVSVEAGLTAHVSLDAADDARAVAEQVGAQLTADLDAQLAPQIAALEARILAAADTAPPSAKQTGFLSSLMRPLDAHERTAVYRVAGVNPAGPPLTGAETSLLIDTIKGREDEWRPVAAVIAREAAAIGTTIAIPASYAPGEIPF